MAWEFWTKVNWTFRPPFSRVAKYCSDLVNVLFECQALFYLFFFFSSFFLLLCRLASFQCIDVADDQLSSNNSAHPINILLWFNKNVIATIIFCIKIKFLHFNFSNFYNAWNLCWMHKKVVSQLKVICMMDAVRELPDNILISAVVLDGLIDSFIHCCSLLKYFIPTCELWIWPQACLNSKHNTQRHITHWRLMPV